MYPTLSDLIYDLFGFHILLPIQTFGFFVSLSFVFCAYLFSKELKRKEDMGLISPQIVKPKDKTATKQTDILMSALVGFVTGYKVVYAALNYHEFASNPQEAILSTKGHLLGGLVFAAISGYLKYKESKKEEAPKEETQILHPYELVPNMTMISALSGLLGAKIFHNLENLDDFMADPWGSLISFSGLTFYGGLIFGAIAVCWYAKRNGIKLLPLIDACAPGLMLAYGFGRIGCQMAGDGDWGIVNLNPKPGFLSWLPDWTWAYNYPHNVINEGVKLANCDGPHCSVLAQPVYPTPLYEAVVGIGLFLFLWAIRKRINKPGMLFSIYLVVNGIERFFIEKIRVNTLYNIGGYHPTQAEIISTLLVIVGVAGIFYFNKDKTPVIS